MMTKPRSSPPKRRAMTSPSHRPKKSFIGNVILSAAAAVVVFVVTQNFRVLSMLGSTSDVVLLEELPQQQQEYTPTLLLDDESIHTFVVWTYPASPDIMEDTELQENELLLCSYPPCGSLQSQRLNLQELVQNTTFQDFIQNHTLNKVAQKDDYLHHVQSVTLLSLIRRYPNKCARTWGDSTHTICGSDLAKYAQYNPTSPKTKLPIDTETIPPFRQVHFSALGYDSKIKLVKEANMEDELQTLAAVQFYPHVTNFVDRDMGLTKVGGHLLCNARFRTTFSTPSSLTDIWDTSFPSIQLRYDAKSTVKSHLWLLKGYNDKSGAIGAEDVSTLDFLRELGVWSSYLALSFTIMLGRELSPKRNKIVIVDVKPGLLPPGVEKNAVTLQRTVKEPSRSKRLRYAEKILDTYSQKAKVVITSRIQMAMPAIAMGIPVIYVGMKDYLEGNGVDDMFHVFDPYNGDTWTFNLEKALPSTKPGVHRADRARASFWNLLKRESSFYSNTAYLYGIVPFQQRLGRSVPDEESLHTLFHFIFTTPKETLTWREKRAIEHVFYFHPNAKVIVHSNTLKQGDCELDVFAESGYDFTIQPYDLRDMLRKTVSDKKLVDSFVPNLSEFEKGEHWYSHETDILRYTLLWHYSGVYLDTDMYLIKPLSRDLMNVVAYQDPKHEYVSGAVMIFEQRHALLQAALQWTLENYAEQRSEWPILGSSLMTLLSKDEKYQDTFKVLDDASFYPIDWESIDKCFTEELSDLDLSATFAVHLNTKITAHYHDTTQGTFCDKLLHAYCIFCDEVHTVKKEEPDVVVEDIQVQHDDGGGFQGFMDIGQDHSFVDEKPPAAEGKKEKKPSFFSRFVSSIFGRGEKKKPYQTRTVAVAERKALPPVHMEFVKEKD